MNEEKKIIEKFANMCIKDIQDSYGHFFVDYFGGLEEYMPTLAKLLEEAAEWVAESCVSLIDSNLKDYEDFGTRVWED